MNLRNARESVLLLLAALCLLTFPTCSLSLPYAPGLARSFSGMDLWFGPKPQSGKGKAKPVSPRSLVSPTVDPKVVNKMVDATIAGAGLAATLAALVWSQDRTGVKMFCPPMMSSGITFFAGQSPPDPTGFALGTMGALTLFNGLDMFRNSLGTELVTGLTAGFMLVWYKATNTMFPPSMALTLLMIQSNTANTSPIFKTSFNLPNLKLAASYLCFPWITGHCALYVSAMGFSAIRCAVRHHMMRQQLRTLSPATLRQTFDKFDTSGDGFLDPVELKVALRAAIGAEVSVEDCKRMVGAMDTDGDGVVDFEEFSAICKTA